MEEENRQPRAASSGGFAEEEDIHHLTKGLDRADCIL
jgi:hypothetical protein